MRNKSVLLFVLFALCAGLAACVPPAVKRFATPASLDLIPDRAYPLEVSYELLALGRAEACGEFEEGTVNLAGSTAGDPMVGNFALYQEAKFQAIESVPGADNLLFVRAKALKEGRKECVTVIGRAFRVAKMHARPAVALDGEAPAGPAALPATTTAPAAALAHPTVEKAPPTPPVERAPVAPPTEKAPAVEKAPPPTLITPAPAAGPGADEGDEDEELSIEPTKAPTPAKGKPAKGGAPKGKHK